MRSSARRSGAAATWARHSTSLVLVLVLVVLSSPHDHGMLRLAAATATHADLLRKCFREGELLQRQQQQQQQAGLGLPSGATFKAFLNSQHARLHLEAVLWSSKQPCGPPSEGKSNPHDPCPLTIVTTLTLSRLHGLEQLCDSWPGPLVAALYVALDVPADSARNRERLNNATATAEQLQRRMDGRGRSCALRVLVLSEVLQEPVMQMLLPINSLRNAALLAASTPLVSMIDVDLVLSASLGQQLIPASPPASSSLSLAAPGGGKQRGALELLSWCEDNAAIILPALEPHTGRRQNMAQLLQWADKSIQGDKAQLISMVEAKEMCFFQELSYPRGHRLTDFPRWYKEQERYPIKWQLFYEPWFVLARARNPWYDVRFQGYGYNKQNHVAGLAGSGIKFWVHPNAWVVHRPHDKTPVHRLYVVALNSRAKLLKAGKDVELPGNWTEASELSAAQVGALLQHHVNTMFHANKREMQAGGKYAPHVDAMTRHCVEVLPWWAGRGAHAGFFAGGAR